MCTTLSRNEVNTCASHFFTSDHFRSTLAGPILSSWTQILESGWLKPFIDWMQEMRASSPSSSLEERTKRVRQRLVACIDRAIQLGEERARAKRLNRFLHSRIRSHPRQRPHIAIAEMGVLHAVARSGECESWVPSRLSGRQTSRGSLSDARILGGAFTREAKKEPLIPCAQMQCK